RVIASGDHEIVGTGDHEVLTAEGWKRIEQLEAGSKLVINAGADSGLYRGHNQLGERGWSEWMRWRLSQPERCSSCGAEGVRLETHHRDRNRQNNDESNLQLLCCNCHKEAEGISYSPWHRGWAAAYADVVPIDPNREAQRHGVAVKLPDVRQSDANWRPRFVHPQRRPGQLPTIRAGFQSIEGIGEKSAPGVAEWRDAKLAAGEEPTWGGLRELRGFG